MSDLQCTDTGTGAWPARRGSAMGSAEQSWPSPARPWRACGSARRASRVVGQAELALEGKEGGSVDQYTTESRDVPGSSPGLDRSIRKPPASSAFSPSPFSICVLSLEEQIDVTSTSQP